MTHEEVIEIRTRLDWPGMGVADRSMLEALIRHAAEITHETGTPGSLRESVTEAVHSFLESAGRSVLRVPAARMTDTEIADVWSRRGDVT